MVETRSERVRADAVRNRQAVVAAARAAVEVKGIEVSLEKIAEGAGVSVRTLYRHFPTRGDLLAAVFEDYFAERVEPVLRRAADDPDPRRALTTVLAESTAAFVENRTMHGLAESSARTADITARYLEPLADIVSRAQQAGEMRADIVAEDFPCLVTMLVASAGSAGTSGTNWSRYLALVLDGLDPAAARSPLPPVEAAPTQITPP